MAVLTFMPVLAINPAIWIRIAIACPGKYRIDRDRLRHLVHQRTTGTDARSLCFLRQVLWTAFISDATRVVLAFSPHSQFGFVCSCRVNLTDLMDQVPCAAHAIGVFCRCGALSIRSEWILCYVANTTVFPAATSPVRWPQPR